MTRIVVCEAVAAVVPVKDGRTGSLA